MTEKCLAVYDVVHRLVAQDLAIAESQLWDYQARLGTPFRYESYLSELTALRDRLKAGLSGATAEPGTEHRVL